MKTFAIIKKGIKEQIRSYWILLLTLSMGPFFIFVYYLIVESSKQHYDLLIVNNDKGIISGSAVNENYGDSVISWFSSSVTDSQAFPLSVKRISNTRKGIDDLSYKRADALIVLPEDFSETICRRRMNDSSFFVQPMVYGDLTDTKYLITAVWANELLNEFTFKHTNNKRLVSVKEIPIGASAKINDFDMIVPGILVVSIIMLMFTASIAFVSEVENSTILRLKLSGVSSFEFLGGVGIVQSIVGVFAAVLTLFTAIALGFHYQGSVIIMLFISMLTSLSIIAFSLIIASVSKSANEVLIIGNFPMFLFMFFTGAAFPLKSEPLFTLAGYPVSIQGLMTPVHAISALNKTLVMNMDFRSILPEIIAILVLTAFYFVTGAIMFRFRHLRLHY